jgi:hypothetical protein
MCQEVACNIERSNAHTSGVFGIFVTIEEGRRTVEHLSARRTSYTSGGFPVRSLRVKMSRPLLIAHHGGVRSP